MQASLLAVQQTRHLQRHLPGQWELPGDTRSLLLVHPTTSSTLPHDSKTEASLQTIGLLEVLGSHKILSTGSDPRLAFPGPYRPRVQVLASSGAWRPEGRGDGQQTQRSCTKHMATRWSREKGSTEVEKTESQQTENSHQCTCAELAQPWWDKEDRARPSHQHAQLPPTQDLGPAKVHTAQ